jgi:hypothetical protein
MLEALEFSHTSGLDQSAAVLSCMDLPACFELNQPWQLLLSVLEKIRRRRMMSRPVRIQRIQLDGRRIRTSDLAGTSHGFDCSEIALRRRFFEAIQTVHD